MKENPVLYTFTPQFKGAFLQGVPRRDLTAKDVANMPADKQRDAFAPHPLYGTPLYTKVEPAKVSKPVKDGDA